MVGKKSKKSKEYESDGWFGYYDPPLQCLNLMVSEPYYLFHLLAFLSYIPIRLSSAPFLSAPFSSHLLHREIQAFLAFCVLAAIKMVRVETWQHFIADALFFAKIFLVAVALVMDYHLALWYTLIFVVTWISTQQPAYEGLGTANQLTPLQLETLLTEGSTSRFWLVEFRSSSTSTCIYTSSFFPELSITYSTRQLSFGIVDLGLFPNAAVKFGIPFASLNQLPTYILFEGAEEVARYPKADFESRYFDPTITKKLLCRHFELDRHLIEYVKS